MAKNGGARIGAGRPKGSVCAKSTDAVAAALADGISPVEFMLNMMRDDAADPKERAWAAEKSAPYVHPRPAPVARTIEIDLPDMTAKGGITAALSHIAKAAATGRIAPSEAQSLAAIVEAQRRAFETGEILARLEALENSPR